MNTDHEKAKSGRTGRPKIPDSERKSQVSIYLTPGDMAKLKGYSDNASEAVEILLLADSASSMEKK
jgi:hypothetical protein